MTRFVRVQADGQYASYNVPTEDEYDDYREKVNQCFERLNAKVEALEDKIAVLSPRVEEPFTDGKIILTLMNGKGDMLELEGTEKHFVDFEAERKAFQNPKLRRQKEDKPGPKEGQEHYDRQPDIQKVAFKGKQRALF